MRIILTVVLLFAAPVAAISQEAALPDQQETAPSEPEAAVLSDQPETGLADQPATEPPDPQTEAQDPPSLDIRNAADVTLEEFLWLNRLIVVFADTDRDPAFRKQMELLNERPLELIDRDVVVIVDTDPANPSAIRQKLRPRGFGFVFIDKDGVIKLRKPTPWAVREISRSIDKTPLRQDELRERRDAS